MHGGRVFVGVLCIFFFSAVRTGKLRNVSGFFCMSFVQAGKKVLYLARSAGWDAKGSGSIWELLTKSYRRGKWWLLHSTCYLWESAALPSPSSFPASPGSAEITFHSRSAHARLSIKLGKRIPWGRKARFSVCLIYGPSLAWYNGGPAVGILCHPLEDAILQWQDMKGGLKNTLQRWWLTTVFLVTINSTFSPTLSDSSCSQARGNRNIFLLSHTPSSPWQQMGKYYK